MPFFFPPPPAQTGGAQPYAGRQIDPNDIAVPVNPPPFQSRGLTAWYQSVVNTDFTGTSISGLTLDPYNRWPYMFLGNYPTGPYMPMRVDPGDLNNPPNPPPPSQGGPFNLDIQLVLAWEIFSPGQPNAWTYLFNDSSPTGPYMPGRVDPSDLNVPVNPPPPSQGGPDNYEQYIVQQWNFYSPEQPNPWTYQDMRTGGPYYPQKMAPGIPGQSIDRPPFGHRARTEWFQSVVNDDFTGTSTSGLSYDPYNRWPYIWFGWNGPYMPRHLDPGDFPPTNNPPFGLWTRTRPQPPMIVVPDPFVPLQHMGPFLIGATIRFPFSQGYIVGI